jgi:hypothetical protein
VQYAGPGGGFQGLDQINVMIPQSLDGSVNITIQYGRSGLKSRPRALIATHNSWAHSMAAGLSRCCCSRFDPLQIR